VKSTYIGWIVIVALIAAGLLAIAVSPKWRHAPSTSERLMESAKRLMAQGPPAEPGEGKVTANLSRAMRLHLPIVAIFTQHVHEHIGGPEHMRRAAEERAEHEMFAKLAADYKGAVAVVEVSANASPASVVRSKVTIFPAAIIYGADHRELWRHEGEVKMDQIRVKLAALNILPRPQTPPAAPSR